MPETQASWKDDLHANSRQRGSLAPIIAWFIDPGFACVILIRMATMSRTNLIRKLMARWAASRLVYKFGCYISVEATIGRRLVLPHPVGIVIGENTTIGDDVTIYQHVTIGRRTNLVAEYPRIGDGAVIYAGAVLVGGIEIGKGAAIGANAVVLTDIRANSSAAGIPARILKSSREPSPESSAPPTAT